MARRWPRWTESQRRRPGLRARIIAAFGIGALVLSASIAATAYISARSTIVGQAVSTAESSAVNDDLLIQKDIAFGLVTPEQLEQVDDDEGVLRSASILYATRQNPVERPNGSVDDLINFEGLSTPVLLQKSDVPSSLAANRTQPSYQIFAAHGETFIGVAIPLSSSSDYRTYVVIFPALTESHTLNVLFAALMIAIAAATVLGAVVGRWAARRALAPLRRAANAARAIASGELDTRIETQDTSDLRVLATSFNSMVDALQDRIAREARFTSDVAHELRSPLTTLATALSVIESRRSELSERSQHALDLLSEEVKRFRVLVTDLLEISRADAHVEGLSESLVEIGPLMQNSLENAGAEDLPVEIEPRLARRWLYVDKRRFERIVTNLVENADHYGGGVTRIAVVEPDPDHVHICVEDSGPGIPEEERERIFDRFARGSAAGRRGAGAGSGLGLALVAEHVRLHNGKVWVEPSSTGGARFVVELPFAPPELLEELDSDEPAEGIA